VFEHTKRRRTHERARGSGQTLGSDDDEVGAVAVGFVHDFVGGGTDRDTGGQPQLVAQRRRDRREDEFIELARALLGELPIVERHGGRRNQQRVVHVQHPHCSRAALRDRHGIVERTARVLREVDRAQDRMESWPRCWAGHRVRFLESRVRFAAGRVWGLLLSVSSAKVARISSALSYVKLEVRKSGVECSICQVFSVCILTALVSGRYWFFSIGLP